MAKSIRNRKQQEVGKGRLNGNILGVRVSSTSFARVLREIQVYISKAKKFYIVTPNPEIVMQAQEDKLLTRVLNSATISLPDGIGLAQARKFMDLPNPKGKVKRFLTLLAQGMGIGFLTLVDIREITGSLSIIHGRKMFIELIKLANRKKWRVFLLGGETNEAVSTESEIEKTFKSVSLKSFSGPMLDESGDPTNGKEKEKERKAVKMINDFKPHLLFIGFGAPKQEKWVYRWYKKLNIGGAMVVGGTFRYISRNIQNPPTWIEDRELEWIWRLFSGSQKTERVFKAFPKFPLTVFREKWRN